MEQPGITKQVAGAVDKGWVAGGSLVGSVLSGVLIGFLLDRWLGTDPWLVIVFLLVGSYSGFMRLWRYAQAQGAIEDEERRRARD